jgi:hypothetical protein
MRKIGEQITVRMRSNISLSYYACSCFSILQNIFHLRCGTPSRSCFIVLLNLSQLVFTASTRHHGTPAMLFCSGERRADRRNLAFSLRAQQSAITSQPQQRQRGYSCNVISCFLLLFGAGSALFYYASSPSQTEHGASKNW